MKKIDIFMENCFEFQDIVRSNKGFDEVKFEALCNSIKDLEVDFRKNNCVPLCVANIFIDLYSAIESCAYRHDEEMKEKILLAADKIACIARDITSD